MSTVVRYKSDHQEVRIIDQKVEIRTATHHILCYLPSNAEVWKAISNLTPYTSLLPLHQVNLSRAISISTVTIEEDAAATSMISDQN